MLRRSAPPPTYQGPQFPVAAATGSLAPIQLSARRIAQPAPAMRKRRPPNVPGKAAGRTGWPRPAPKATSGVPERSAASFPLSSQQPLPLLARLRGCNQQSFAGGGRRRGGADRSRNAKPARPERQVPGGRGDPQQGLPSRGPDSPLPIGRGSPQTPLDQVRRAPRPLPSRPSGLPRLAEAGRRARGCRVSGG